MTWKIEVSKELYYTNKHPMPYSLPIGMLFTLTGLLLLAFAPTYGWVIVGAMVLGTGSSVFHPESSRVARMASGGRFGLAQSIFQVGGNIGTSCGPLLAAAVIIANGRSSLSWFAVFPLLGLTILTFVSGWAKKRTRVKKQAIKAQAPTVSRSVLIRTFAALLVLIFSKYFYTASISSYLGIYFTNTPPTCAIHKDYRNIHIDHGVSMSSDG